MGTLCLVRHGQASFGADDYDKLSDLGHRQCVRLGEYFRDKGVRFDAAIVGTLRRQEESLAGIAQGLGWDPQPLARPGLNEYDSHAVISAFHTEPLAKPTSAEMVRHHFRLLRDGLGRWMDGRSAPLGMPSYAEFVAGVNGVLDHVRENHFEQKVLVVSSGGPISTAVGQVLGMSPAATIELNLRIRNSSVTEFTFTPKRHMLLTYNTLPHLDAAAYEKWVTYA